MDATQFEDAILGAIIKEPLSPSTNYVPDFPAKYKSHEYQQGSATDFVLTGASAGSKELGVSLKSIGGYSVSGNKAESVHLAGKFIRYKRIQQLDQFWAKLKEDVDVKKTAPNWVSFFSSWPVCLVVGIMVCEDVELSLDGTQSRIHEGKAELPIGQIALTAGIPNEVGDLQGALTSNQQTVTIFKAKVGKSNIFAVELRKITTGLFKQTLLRLMGDGPMVDGIRLASDEFDDEEDIDKPVAAEDLILDEFGPEDYEDMVEQGIL